MNGVLEEVSVGIELAPELVSVMAESKSAVVLSLDIGTSGVRAALFDDHGRQIEGAVVRIERADTGLSDYSTLDPDITVALVIETIDQLFATPIASLANIQLISISCFWHSLMGINSAGEPTTPVLGWAETRAASAAKDLRTRFNEVQTHSRTGCRFHPSYWPAKLLWLQRTAPFVFNNTSHWLSFSEYLTLRLFGETAISVSMASGTGLMNQYSCDWDEPLLHELQISTKSLPQIADDGISSFSLISEYSERWPQLSDAKLYPAIADGAANNVGSGCTTKDKLAVMIGTSGAARVLYRGRPPDEIPSELWCYRADRRRVIVGGALSDGGGLYRWLHERLLPGQPLSETADAVEMIEPDSHGLTILPFWSGERSTGWSLNAKGGIFGLTRNTRPEEILSAAMEAIAYRFALILRALEPITSAPFIVASGNALQSSPLWLQILADVFGQPVSLSEAREASARGAALLALEAAGKIQNIDSYNSELGKTFTPNASRHERYVEAVKRQQKMYELLLGG